MSVEVGFTVDILPAPEITVETLSEPQITVTMPPAPDVTIEAPTNYTLEFTAPDTNIIEVTIDGCDCSGGGEGSSNYTHVQSMLNQNWVVVHNLGRKPTVQARDAVDTVIFGSVQHDSENQLTVHFASAITGRAYCT